MSVYRLNKRLGSSLVLILVLASNTIGVIPVGATIPNRKPLPVLGLNDVSFLIPLPKEQSSVDFLLRPQTEGKNGLLLPRGVFEHLPDLVVGKEPTGGASPTPFPRDEVYSSLRVVSLRVDPCFPVPHNLHGPY